MLELDHSNPAYDGAMELLLWPRPKHSIFAGYFQDRICITILDDSVRPVGS